MSEINNYDPNPYDDVTIDEALAQIYDRVNDRTIRQMVILLKNTAGDTSRYIIEKATAESGEVTYTLMQQISGGTPTPVGDIVSLRGSQILANYDGELQILDNIISIINVALDGKADTTDIPTVPIMAIQKNGTGITPVDGTVNITVPVVAADVAALPDNTRYAAALSLTIDGATFVVTGQLKDQNGDNLGTAQTIDLPLESVVVGGSYNSQTQKVVLTLQNGNTIEFSVADLVYGLQTELSETNKLNPAYINYDNTHRAVSDAEKSEWNGKQDAIDSSHKLSADLVDDTGATNKFATEEELEQIETNKNNISSLYKVGSANILKNTAQTQVLGGVTFTMNADGSITANGTKNNNDWLYLSTGNSLKAGTYVLSSGGITGSDKIVVVATADSLGSAIMTTSTATGVFERELTQDYSGLYYAIRIANGTVCDNLLFKPMLCEKSVYEAINGEFQPYALSNAELTAKEQTNENNILFNTNTGVKNVAPLKSSVNTGSAIVTFTQNADKSYTLAISATTSAVVVFDISDTFTLDSTMQYVLSGNPSSGPVRLVLAEGVTPFNWIDQQYGDNPKTITPVADKVYKLTVFIYANTPATTLTLKPMICPKSLYDSDSGYQPYAMSNAELTTKEQQNKISFGFSGNPNPAVYVKDWDFIPDGTYLLTYICSSDASTRKGVSVYMFTKYTTNHLVLFTPVVEVSGAVITSCVATGAAGAETITFTMGQRGYHTAAAIQIQAF